MIITANYNKLPIDRTKWYRINYEALENLESFPLYQNDTTIVSKWYDQWINMIRPLPEINTENNAEIKQSYIEINFDGNVFINIYNNYFKNRFNKDHMRVTEEQYETIIGNVDLLENYDITEEAFEEAVQEHFNNLPKANNGNILAFIPAFHRYFEIMHLGHDYNWRKKRSEELKEKMNRRSAQIG
ncbi:MAG: hypothetical protein JWM44_3515 [Bacilli bacterium]|nr:hypothetical protein [Bacilli bacterium]